MLEREQGAEGRMSNKAVVEPVYLRPRVVVNESLDGEVAALREALGQAKAGLRSDEGDVTKLGGLVARLSDSIVRALLAQKKLAADGDGGTWLRAEFERVLRALGAGETEL